jgi:hypothetical protein
MDKFDEKEYKSNKTKRENDKIKLNNFPGK